MGKILIVDKDALNVPIMKELLKAQDLAHVETVGEAYEHLNHHEIDLVIIEHAMLDKEFNVWLEEFKRSCQMSQNQNVKFVFVSHRDDQKWARRLTTQGAFDYIVKPIDRPLFLQKIGLILSGRVEKQVYTFRTDHPISVAYEATVEEVSEFGLMFKSDRALKEGEILSFVSDMFGEKEKGEVLARCYQVEAHPDDKAQFRAHMMFVGVTPHVLQCIRHWLRLEYVRKKQQAS